jgi:FecR protein
MSDMYEESLDGLLREARATAPPDIDWKRIDAGLFERVNRDAAHMRALAAHRGRWGIWIGLGGLAVAAVVAVAVQPASKAREPAFVNRAFEGSAGDLTLQQGSGDVWLAGAKAHAGTHARAGETVSTHGAQALFESEGRVSWVLENESRVRIERTTLAGSALVLALLEGAVEAQVTPVASGEAFAIDVDGVRIAVHGTHLRVARDGDRVVVDLSEGMVSIGAPPRVGSTYGTLVTAPAHVEFRAGALADSISIDHAPAFVRGVTLLNEVSDEGASIHVDPRSSVAPVAPSSLPSWRPTPRLSTAPLAPNPLADAIVASAVRACATGGPHSNDVTITVSSTLTVDVRDDGFARLASFDPPLAPDIQACASRSIYSMRFASAGRHTISIALER